MKKDTYQDKLDRIIGIEEVATLLFHEDDPGKWLCPFHADRHPGSFKVFRINQRFKCFSCGAFGGSIRLTMQVKNCSFQEAVQWLSTQKGHSVSLPKKERVPELCSVILRDPVYRKLMMGMSLKDPKYLALTDSDRIYLHDRGISDEMIVRYGYFTMPDRTILPHLVHNLSLLGITEEELMYVPGFYRHRRDGRIDMVAPNGIGIPIHDHNGRVVAIQVRKYKVHSGENRYVWFSSGWLYENAVAREMFMGGASSGSPIDVISGSGNVLALTEGNFKAVILKTRFTGMIWSLQGVGMQRELVGLLEEQKELHTVYLAFDADHVINKQVYKHIVQAGKKCMEYCRKVEVLCWNFEEGKGIDDALLKGVAVYSVPFAAFCKENDKYWQDNEAKSDEEKMRAYAKGPKVRLHRKKYRVL